MVRSSENVLKRVGGVAVCADDKASQIPFHTAGKYGIFRVFR
jgi:hypothetical protein